MSARPAVLVIAGVDSSGGAGLLRDAQTLAAFGVDALCAVTAVTAQSDREVAAVHAVPAPVIAAQLRAALGSGRVRAIKIGMLGTRAAVQAVAGSLAAREGSVPVVLDPVLRASSGARLLDAQACGTLRERLLPLASLATPNLPELAALLDEPGGDPAVDRDERPVPQSAAPRADQESAWVAQARGLLALGPQAVLLKGGHAGGGQAIDLLVTAAQVQRFPGPRIAARCRGTGCALASAIAAGLALGLELPQACARAKSYVADLLRAAAATDGIRS